MKIIITSHTQNVLMKAETGGIFQLLRRLITECSIYNRHNELVSTCRHRRKFLPKFSRILNDQS